MPLPNWMRFVRSYIHLALFMTVAGMLTGVSYAQGSGSFTPTSSYYFEVPYGGGIHNFEIATLVTSSVSSFDHLHMIAMLDNGEGSAANTSIDAVFANRAGFAYLYTARGAALNNGVKLTAYQNSDGSVNIYLYFNGVFGTASYSVLENIQETVYATPTDLGSTAPAGTLIFDSSSSLYPPATYLDFAGDLTTNGGIVVGTNLAVQNNLAAGLGAQQLPSAMKGTVTIASPAGDGLGTAANGLIFLDSLNGGASAWTHAAIYTVGSTGYNGSLVFATDGDNSQDFGVTEKMRISPAGNVGIGTTNPGAKLEVNGGVKLTSGSVGGFTFGDGTVQTTAATSIPTIYQANGNTQVNGVLQVAGSATPSTPIQGAYIGWNAIQNTGETDFINNQGGGTGGFAFFNTPSSGTPRSLLMYLTGTGNLGIGTQTPGAKLEVDGNVKLTAGSGASMTFQDGSVQTIAWNGVLQGGDYAESVDVSGDRAEYEPGDVLVVDPTAEGKFSKSSEPYSTNVTGIYSTRPGALGRRQKNDQSHIKDEVPMAMVGVVPTKVSAESGPIHPGDLLVTSSTLGYAMKGADRSRLTGAIIGKALGHLDSGSGLIEVAVSLQ